MKEFNFFILYNQEIDGIDKFFVIVPVGGKNIV